MIFQSVLRGWAKPSEREELFGGFFVPPKKELLGGWECFLVL